MVTHAGPLATRSCEPRQAWKGAAAAADSGAGVWLVGSPPIYCSHQERCLSGRKSTPGKCVYGNVSRVRIPPSPPISSLEQNASSEILLIHATFHASISTPVTQLRGPIRPKRSIHSVRCCGTAPDFPALRQLDEHFSVAFSGQSVLRVENDRDEAK